jgi:hypothetical protein
MHKNALRNHLPWKTSQIIRLEKGLSKSALQRGAKVLLPFFFKKIDEDGNIRKASVGTRNWVQTKNV